MRAKELCYKIEVIPDLSLNKYSSLDGNGVEGVLEKHLAFLRQWNRKGALSGTSIHLYYYYDGQKEDGTYSIGSKGSKLKILFAVRGEEEKLNNVPRLHHRSSQTVLFKFYNFPADILSLLHILFWLTDSLLPICCHSIIAVLKLFRNHYFEYTASFLERRYTQY